MHCIPTSQFLPTPQCFIYMRWIAAEPMANATCLFRREQCRTEESAHHNVTWGSAVSDCIGDDT
jgi:hypothetical protein